MSIRDVTLEQAREIISQSGWDVLEFDESDPWKVWIKIPNGQRLIYLKNHLRKPKRHGKAPVIFHENHWSGGDGQARGKFKYNDHGRCDEKCIEDYASDKGRKLWPKYVVERDESGTITREGPAPFESKDERLRYEALTGQRQRDRGETRWR